MHVHQARLTLSTQSRESLKEVENILLTLDFDSDKAQAFGAIAQRAATLDGLARMLGFSQMANFNGLVGQLVEQVRADRMAVGAPLVVLLLSCCEQMSAMLAMFGATGRIDDALNARTQELAALLRSWLDGSYQAIQGSGEAERLIAHAAAASNFWSLSLHFGPDAAAHGVDPAALVARLNTVGRVITLDPPLEQAGGHQASYEIAFDCDADKAAIEALFDDVKQDCLLYIAAPHHRTIDYVRLINDMPEQGTRLGEILVRCGIVSQSELEAALASQNDGQASTSAALKPPLGSILFGRGAAPAQVVAAALARQQNGESTKP